MGSIERLLAEPQTTFGQSRSILGRLVLDAVRTATLPFANFSVGAGFSLDTMVQDDLIVDGDPVRLRQLLDNLIGNALGHSQSGGSVEVSARRDGASIVVEIADEGDGIRAADLERMFEPGVRLTSDRPGSGLGLAVVRTIARAHGERSRSSRPLVRERRSGSCCRALPANRDAELLLQRAGAGCDAGPHVGRLEHDRLACVGEHLGADATRRS